MPYPIEMKRLMGKWRCRDNSDLSLIIGFDHRIGHFRPLRIIGTTPNSSALNGLGASTWDRSRWGGRRHDQGLLFQGILSPQGRVLFVGISVSRLRGTGFDTLNAPGP